MSPVLYVQIIGEETLTCYPLLAQQTLKPQKVTSNIIFLQYSIKINTNNKHLIMIILKFFIGKDTERPYIHYLHTSHHPIQ
jgi:hypothetical protein